MAETLTTRMGVRQYGAGTDTFSRVEWNAVMQQIEDLTAIDSQGTFASRPAAGVRGRYYYATDTGFLYRDTGAAWVSVASRGTDALFNASGAGTVPLTASAGSGQTANLFEAKTNNVLVAAIDPAGVLSGDSFVGKSVALTGTSVGTVVADVKGASGQTADLLRVRNNSNTNMLTVGASGALTGKYIQAGDGTAAIGTDTLSSPAGMSLFTGTPAMEVYGKKGAANSAFSEFMYLHHLAADATVATRRLGLLMHIGDVSGDATKSGAIYIESTVANAANPDLVLAQGDTPVARFKQDGTSVLDTKPTFNGTVTITPGTAASLVSGSTALGTHAGNDQYQRANTGNGFYWYSGGLHSATPGDPGTGGTRLASLLKSGSVGLLATDKMTLGTGSRVPSSTTQSLRIGTSSGNRLNFAEDGIQAATGASSASTLFVNTSGGNINLGDATSIVSVPGTFKVGGRTFTIADTAPSSPNTGDVWIDT